MQRLQPDDVLRAYADNIGFLLTSLWKTLPGLFILYEGLKTFSGLSVRVRRCVVVPLWASSMMSKSSA
eukprot:9321268-Karenia_brevis.AAC.1